MFSFEKLTVYSKAFETNQIVYKNISTNNSLPAYFKNQFGRASLSIMFNIAEGSAKFSKRDRKNFFSTARGSAFECAALVVFLKTCQQLDYETAEALYGAFEEISKMLFKMINSLEE